MSIDRSSVKNNNPIEVITEVWERSRCTPEQKLDSLKQTFGAGMTVSMAADQVGIAVSQRFQWNRASSEGSPFAVGANGLVVSASEIVEALKGIKQLGGALGRTTVECGKA